MDDVGAAGIGGEAVENDGVARVSEWENEMRERRAGDCEGIGRAPSNSDAMVGALELELRRRNG